MPTRSPKDKLTGDRAGDEPTAPAIPSFASLRAQRRRSPVDLLVPEPAARVSSAADRAAPRPPDRAAPRPPDRAAPRPPDYVDLLRLGLHVARALASLPVRVTLWSVREPMRLLRRPGRPRGQAPR